MKSLVKSYTKIEQITKELLLFKYLSMGTRLEFANLIDCGYIWDLFMHF